LRFQPLVEPLELHAPDGGARVAPEIDIRKLDRHVVRPRANHDAMHARVPPQRAKRRQVALDETVVPAPDRKYGHVNLVQAGTRARTPPEAIISGVIERFLKSFVPLARGCKI